MNPAPLVHASTSNSDRAASVHLQPLPAAVDARPPAGVHPDHHLRGVGDALAVLNHHLRHLPVPVLDAEEPSFIL